MSNTHTLYNRIIAEIADATEAEIVVSINYEILNINGDTRLRNPEEQVLANMVHGMMPLESDIRETPAEIAEQWINGDFEPESKRAELEADADSAFDRLAADAVKTILSNRVEAN